MDRNWFGTESRISVDFVVSVVSAESTEFTFSQYFCFARQFLRHSISFCQTLGRIIFFKAHVSNWFGSLLTVINAISCKKTLKIIGRAKRRYYI